MSGRKRAPGGPFEPQEAAEEGEELGCSRSPPFGAEEAGLGVKDALDGQGGGVGKLRRIEDNGYHVGVPVTGPKRGGGSFAAKLLDPGAKLVRGSLPGDGPGMRSIGPRAVAAERKVRGREGDSQIGAEAVNGTRSED